MDNYFYMPRIVITTSRRKSHLTNTFLKALSGLLGAPILRRGTSNLDEIAYNIVRDGYEGFIVVYTRMGNPSVLTFYRLVEQGFFDLFGRIFILGVYINRRFKGQFEVIQISRDCVTPECNELYSFLSDFFAPWKIKNDFSSYSVLKISELKEYREKWLRNKTTKFKPAQIDFMNHRGQVVWLRIRVHHCWRSKRD